MKKSLVLTLVVVYVLSICVVGYFGLNVRIYRPTVYPASLEITKIKDEQTGKEVEIRTNDKGEKYVRLDKYTENCSVKIYFRFSPDETTKRDVYFSQSVKGVCSVYQISKQITSEAQVIFEKNRLVTVSIYASNAPTVFDSIRISFQS